MIGDILAHLPKERVNLWGKGGRSGGFGGLWEAEECTWAILCFVVFFSLIRGKYSGWMAPRVERSSPYTLRAWLMHVKHTNRYFHDLEKKNHLKFTNLLNSSINDNGSVIRGGKSPRESYQLCPRCRRTRGSGRLSSDKWQEAKQRSGGMAFSWHSCRPFHQGTENVGLALRPRMAKGGLELRERTTRCKALGVIIYGVSGVRRKIRRWLIFNLPDAR